MSEQTDQSAVTPAVSSATYEIIQSRLKQQQVLLSERLNQLNESRKQVFGSIDFSLLANERISTDSPCQVKDIFSLGQFCILGYNVHLGLKTEIELKDVFAVYQFRKNRFEPQSLQILENPEFLEEFKNLYKYYRNTFFARFYSRDNFVYFVFQLSESVSDVKVFKWLVRDEHLEFVDARSAAELQFPNQQEVQWIKATRDMQRSGKFPHISLADKLFVETIGGNLTIKIEDNTDTGLGIYQEDVEYKDQSLDDAEIHFAIYNHLILLRIKPYLETDRYFIYNQKEKRIERADGMKHAIVQLPEQQGVVFPNGYALQTGKIKVFNDRDRKMNFLKKWAGPNGENYLFVFYEERNNHYLLVPYQLIEQNIETPIYCTGFTIFEDGKLCYIQESEEPTKHHAVQIWQTPFSKQVQVNETQKDHTLFKIGNKDLVRSMADCRDLMVLLQKEDSYTGLYDDIVKRSTQILDAYYFLDDEAVFQLKKPLLEIRKIAHAAINEFEKVVEQRQSSHKAIEAFGKRIDDFLYECKTQSFYSLNIFVDALSAIRRFQGEVVTLSELKYADVNQLQNYEKQLSQKSEELSKNCTHFLLQEEALRPYHQQAANLREEIERFSKAIESKNIEESLDELSIQLELLVGIVNNLKIEDTAQSTKIIEEISLIFSKLNQDRSALSKRKREITGKELQADYNAQIVLFDQAVINFSELANTAEKCDEYLNKLSIQLEELGTRFADFSDYLEELDRKREEVNAVFQSKRSAIAALQSKRSLQQFSSGQRILNSIRSKAMQIESDVEMNGFFAADLMVSKVRDIILALKDSGDTAKSEELSTLLKTTQQDCLRQLKDKKELYSDDGQSIAFGAYHFAVNQFEPELSIIQKDHQFYFHITGTSFYEKISSDDLLPYEEVWKQAFISENDLVKRAEFLAWMVFQKFPNPADADHLRSAIEEIVNTKFGMGFVKGLHDQDSLKILQVIQRMHQQLELLRFQAEDRSVADLFWHFLPNEKKAYYQNQFDTLTLLQGNTNEFLEYDFLNKQLIEELTSFKNQNILFADSSLQNMAKYLQASHKKLAAVSAEASDYYLKCLENLRQRGVETAFYKNLSALEAHPGICFSIAFAAIQQSLSTQTHTATRGHLLEGAVLLLNKKWQADYVRSYMSHETISGMLSMEDTSDYTVNYHDFIKRLGYFEAVNVPKFEQFTLKKYDLIQTRKQALKTDQMKSQVLSSFVRNRLIHEVYLPLIGNNLSKQIGALGEMQRTDRMGMLLLISPPGYGKTTLMEYLAARLGLIFMKINGPSIGHSILSTDPAEAKNAAARQELQRLNLALEMGDNVMLYLDDIQHCNPEFLQKFISLADGQRKMEGVYLNESKTYELRSKRFCLVMAGNPYNESGETFKIPDMLANRADTYNLGELSGSKQDLFELSMIENAVLSNAYLSRLVQPSFENLYHLVQSVQHQTPIENLQGNFAGHELQDIRQVVEKSIFIRNQVLKVNQLYISSAAMSDEFRHEPPFKLQGSYRDMNKLLSKLQAIHTQEEVMALVLDHYRNESQNLTTGAEFNLLKLKSLLGVIQEQEQFRLDEIGQLYRKNRNLKTGAEQDQMNDIISLLSKFSEGLDGIREVIQKVSGT
jgi:hypothetical protein